MGILNTLVPSTGADLPKSAPVTGITLPTKYRLPEYIQNQGLVNPVPSPVYIRGLLSAQGNKKHEETLAERRAKFMFDPYNQYQINSMLDVLSSAFDPLENGGQFFSFATLGDSASTWLKGIFKDPIQEKSFGMFFNNVLSSTGEDLDVLANIVKAALPKSITTGKQYNNLPDTSFDRIKAAIGIGVKGRYTFDIDVELNNNPDKRNLPELALDLAGEIISDPLNWFTLGTKEIITNVASREIRRGIGEVSDALKFDQPIADLINNTVSKSFSKRLAEAYLKKDTSTFEALTENLWRRVFNKSRYLEDVDLKNLIDPQLKSNFKAGILSALKTGDETATVKMNATIINSLNDFRAAYQGFVLPAENIDKWITRVAGLPFFTPTIFLIKKLGGPVGTYAKNHILNSFKSPYRPAGPSIGDIEVNVERAKRALEELKVATKVDLDPAVAEDIAKEAIAISTKEQVKTYVDLVKDLSKFNVDDFDGPGGSATAKIIRDFIDSRIAEDHSGVYKTFDEFDLSLRSLLDSAGCPKMLLAEKDSILENLDFIKEMYSFSESSIKASGLNKLCKEYISEVFTENAITVKADADGYTGINSLKPLVFDKVTNGVEVPVRDYILDLFAQSGLKIENTSEFIKRFDASITDIKGAKRYLGSFIKEVNDFITQKSKTLDYLDKLFKNKGYYLRLYDFYLDMFTKQFNNLFGTNIVVDEFLKLPAILLRLTDYISTGDFSSEFSKYVFKVNKQNNVSKVLYSYLKHGWAKYISEEELKFFKSAVETAEDDMQYIVGNIHSAFLSIKELGYDDSVYTPEILSFLKTLEDYTSYIDDLTGEEIKTYSFISTAFETLKSTISRSDRANNKTLIEASIIRLQGYNEAITDLANYLGVLYAKSTNVKKVKATFSNLDEVIKESKLDYTAIVTRLIEKHGITEHSDDLTHIIKEVTEKVKTQLDERASELADEVLSSFERFDLDKELAKYYKEYATETAELIMRGYNTEAELTRLLSIPTYNSYVVAHTQIPKDIKGALNKFYEDFYEEVINADVIYERPSDFFSACDKWLQDREDDFIDDIKNSIFKPRLDQNSLGTSGQRSVDYTRPMFLKGEWVVKMVPKERLEKSISEKLLDAAHEIRAIVHEYEPKGYFLGDAADEAIVRLRPTRVAESMDMINGATAEKIRSIKDQNSGLSYYFNPSSLMETITSSDTTEEQKQIASACLEVYNYVEQLERQDVCNKLLQQRIAELGLEEGRATELYIACLDVLESFGKTDPSRLNPEASGLFRFAMLDKLEMTLSNNKTHLWNSLDYYGERLAKGDAQLNEVAADMIRRSNGKITMDDLIQGHTALNDCFRTEMVYRAEFPEIAKELDELSRVRNLLVLDTETFGLNPKGTSGEILEIGGYYWGKYDSAVNLRVNHAKEDLLADNLPELDVQALLANTKLDGTVDDIKAAFAEQYYSAADKTAIVTEQDILREIQERFGNASGLVTMNGSRFDMNYIKTRVNKYAWETSHFLDGHNFSSYFNYDLLRAFNDRNGIHELTSEEVAVFYDWLDDLYSQLNAFNNLRSVNPYQILDSACKARSALNKGYMPHQNLKSSSNAELSEYFDQIIDSIKLSESEDFLAYRSRVWKDTIIKNPYVAEQGNLVASLRRNYEQAWEDFGKGSNAFPEVAAESLEGFIEKWDKVMPPPTSLMAILTKGSMLDAPFSYTYIRKALNERTIEFDVSKISPWSDAWYRVTKNMSKARNLANNIKRADLMFGPGGVYKDQAELIADLTNKIALGERYGYWFGALDINKIQSNDLRFAYAYTIDRSPQYRSHVDALDNLHSEQLNIFKTEAAIAEKHESFGNFTVGSLMKEDTIAYSARTLNEVTEAIVEDIPEHIFLSSVPRISYLRYLSANAEKATDVLEGVSRYVSYNISSAANSYANTARTSRLREALASLKNFFKHPERQAIFNEIEAMGRAEYKRIYTDFMQNVLQGHVDGTNVLSEEGKRWFTQYLLFESPYVVLEKQFIPSADNKTYAGFVWLLESCEEDLKAWGIRKAKLDPVKDVYYLSNKCPRSLDYNGTSAMFNGIRYEAPVPGTVTHLECPEKYLGDPQVVEIFNALNEAADVAFRYSNGSSANTLGGIFTEFNYEKSMERLLLRNEDLDMIPVQELVDSHFFDTVRFNKSRIIPKYKYYGKTSDETFARSYIGQALKQLEYASRNTSNLMLYTDLFFNKDWGMHFDIDTGIFANVYKNAPSLAEADKEVAKAWNNSGDYVAGYLVTDRHKLGYHAEYIDIRTGKDVARARELGAIIIPYSVYSKAFDSINNNLDNVSGLGHVYRKIVAFYKVGYLISMGTWMRNAIDSPFKTMVTTGQPLETLRYLYKSCETQVKFDKIFREMLEDNPKMSYSSTEFRRWFRTKVPKGPLVYGGMSFEEFMNIWGFFQDGPSAGMSAALKKGVSAKRKAAGIESVVDRVCSTVLDPMSKIESTTRFAQYMQLEDAGYSKLTIFRKISEAQFDYETKSPAAKAMENFIPFYNFIKLNFDFWIDQFAGNPRIMRLIDDFMGVQQDSFDLDPYEKVTERSLMYQYMHGNVLLDQDSNLFLKLNPSYMDVINLMMEPINVAIAAKTGMDRYSTLDGFKNYINNSTVFGNLFAPIQNIISNTVEEYTYEEQVTKVPFGKYKGLPVSELLKDEQYLQLMMDKRTDDGENWLKKNYPSIWRQAMEYLDKTDRIMYFGKYEGLKLHDLIQDYPEYCQYLLSQDWFREEYKDICDIFIANGLNEIKTMTFGKYKGQPMEEVLKDTRYCEYLLSQPWFAEDQALIYNYIVNGQKTIIPESKLIMETLMTPEEAMGMFAFGATLDELEGQRHLKNIAKNVFKDTSSYPIFGAFTQRLYGKNATSQKNAERLSTKSDVQTFFGSVFPGVFGAAVRYSNFKDVDSISPAAGGSMFYVREDASSVIPKDSSLYVARRFYAPVRNYNYYRYTSFNKYQHNRGYRKFLELESETLRLKDKIRGVKIS